MVWRELCVHVLHTFQFCMVHLMAKNEHDYNLLLAVRFLLLLLDRSVQVKCPWIVWCSTSLPQPHASIFDYNKCFVHLTDPAVYRMSSINSSTITNIVCNRINVWIEFIALHDPLIRLQPLNSRNIFCIRCANTTCLLCLCLSYSRMG